MTGKQKCAIWGLLICICVMIIGIITIPNKELTNSYSYYNKYGDDWSEDYVYPYISNDSSNWIIESNLRSARYIESWLIICSGFIGAIICLNNIGNTKKIKKINPINEEYERKSDCSKEEKLA